VSNHGTYESKVAWVLHGSRFSRLPTVLISAVRGPADRAISHFFYTFVSLQGKAFSEAAMLTKLASEMGRRVCACVTVNAYVIRMFATRNLHVCVCVCVCVCAGDNLYRYMCHSSAESVEGIVLRYDLLTIQERFPESMVLLARALGTSLTDVVYGRGRSGDGNMRSKKGNVFVKHFTAAQAPARVKDFLQGKWRKKNRRDIALVALANAAMDARMAGEPLSTIEAVRSAIARDEEHFKNDNVKKGGTERPLVFAPGWDINASVSQEGFLVQVDEPALGSLVQVEPRYACVCRCMCVSFSPSYLSPLPAPCTCRWMAPIDALQELQGWQQALNVACPVPSDARDRTCLFQPDGGCTYACMDDWLLRHGALHPSALPRTAYTRVNELYPPMLNASVYRAQGTWCSL
jgi:hypothetical protein